ncbi:hypothetical protein KV100_04035 [Mumia sp. zg.B21]|uniref:hypothetical protein n=1 Tax=Mumia sp. zg.B21 TaxID=2855447 RepID=UPI001C6E8713|nr:hypothetical protein [Mumia sp. zg.B21]MBW9208815.1 hypothetical protein [Mumia sp. zg.B21]
MAAAALVASLAGCDDEPEADATSRLCGMLDPEAAERITGDVELTGFGGGNLDATRRPGNALTCIVDGPGGEDLLQITTMDLSDQAEWAAMQKQLTDEITGSDTCAMRTDEPLGYVCRSTDATEIAVLFPRRWVRVDATARANAEPPEPKAVLTVAANVHANLEAYDEKQ